MWFILAGSCSIDDIDDHQQVNMMRKNRTQKDLNIIQTIGDTEQVSGRPKMNVDFFRCPGIGVTEDFANELDRDTFYIQGCAEIMPDCVRPESRYRGVLGKFFTETVNTVS